MKILIFAGYFYPHKGGLEQYVLNLSRYLSKNHDITIICPKTNNSEKSEIINNCRIIRLPSWDFMKVYPVIYSKNNLKKLNEEKFDLVITNTRFFHASLIGMKFAKKNKIPWIHVEHGTSFVKTNNLVLFLGSRIFDLIFGRKILNSADKIITISDGARDFVNRLSKNKNIQTIYNGIKLNYIKKRGKIKEINKLIFVGRLIYAKGVQDLIIAFSRINNKNLFLTIVGDGPYKSELENLAKRLNLTDKINFVGEKTKQEVLKLLRESDLFINPSYSEGMPTTVLEAGAIGLPVIATDVGGTREIIENNRTGILINPGKPNEIKQAIEFMINKKKEREEYAKNLNNSVKNKFTWEVIIGQWENLISETMIK